MSKPVRPPKPAAPVDESFDPWEQTRPVPLFVIALVFALALWGLSTYLSGYLAAPAGARPQPPAPRSAPLAEAALAPSTAGTDPAILQIVGAGKGAAWSCASCHGAAGQGNLSTPRLAGQPAGYLLKQLQDFASGRRHNESMAQVTQALDAADLAQLADYYAGLELRSAQRPSLGGDLARGAQLARQGDWQANVPACFSCHGSSGQGIAPGFPALAGQAPDYLFAQLAAWHAGERKNSPQRLMDGIARRMSPQDMRAVADYLGTLAPPAIAAPAGTPR